MIWLVLASHSLLHKIIYSFSWMWSFLFLPYRSLMCCSGHLLPTRYFLQLLPLLDVFPVILCGLLAAYFCHQQRWILQQNTCLLLRARCTWASFLLYTQKKPQTCITTNGFHPFMLGAFLGSSWKYLSIGEDASVIHWNLTDFHPGTVTEKGGCVHRLTSS